MNKLKVMALLGLASVLVFTSACGRSQATKDAGESKETEQQGNGADTEESEEGSEETDPEMAEKIGILLPSEQWDSRWKVDAASLEIKFDDFGYLPVIQYAKGDAELQKQQLQELIEQEVVALVVAPVDVYALTEELHEAKEKSIPVISYDYLIMDTADIDYYLTFDTRTVGNQVGEKILAAKGLSGDNQIPLQKPLKMELLMGAPDSIQALFFYNGLMEVLEPYIESGALTVPSGMISFDDTSVMDSDKKIAADRFYALRRDYYQGGFPDILVTADEDFAVEILKDFRWSEEIPYITTAGCKLETVKKIAAETIGATVFLDNRTLAVKCAETVHTLLKGEEDPEISDYEQYDNGVKIVSTVFVDTEVIDKDNYQMLADNGYFTEAELRIQLTPTEAPENEAEAGSADGDESDASPSPTILPDTEGEAEEASEAEAGEETEEKTDPETEPEISAEAEITATAAPESKKN